MLIAAFFQGVFYTCLMIFRNSARCVCASCTEDEKHKRAKSLALMPASLLHNAVQLQLIVGAAADETHACTRATGVKVDGEGLVGVRLQGVQRHAGAQVPHLDRAVIRARYCKEIESELVAQKKNVRRDKLTSSAARHINRSRTEQIRVSGGP
jgi:hypothetical protein